MENLILRHYYFKFFSDCYAGYYEHEAKLPREVVKWFSLCGKVLKFP